MCGQNSYYRNISCHYSFHVTNSVHHSFAVYNYTEKNLCHECNYGHQIFIVTSWFLLKYSKCLPIITILRQKLQLNKTKQYLYQQKLGLYRISAPAPVKIWPSFQIQLKVASAKILTRFPDLRKRATLLQKVPRLIFLKFNSKLIKEN